MSCSNLNLKCPQIANYISVCAKQRASEIIQSLAQSTILARNLVLTERGAAKTKFSFFCEHSHTGVYTHPVDWYPGYIEYW